MEVELTELLVAPDESIRSVMARINDTGTGIALVVDPERRLLGTITDGDVRRAILAHFELERPACELLEHKSGPFRTPLTAPAGTPPEQLLQLMQESTLRHIPLLDAEGCVVDIAMLGTFVDNYEIPLHAVVMAGGSGARLRPLTEQLPKPMLPIGDTPLLELIVQQLREAGIHRVSLTTHYRGDQIQEHFGDGQLFGVDIRYVNEDEPMGTAGALGLLEDSDEPLLVMNGDIFTRLDFRALVRFHEEHEADMTVAVRRYEIEVPFGLVETEGAEISGVKEKPILRHLVNAGIYLLSPEVRRFVTPGEPHDMVELIEALVREGKRVIAFPIHEYWLDIGDFDSYERARSDAR